MFRQMFCCLAARTWKRRRRRREEAKEEKEENEEKEEAHQAAQAVAADAAHREEHDLAEVGGGGAEHQLPQHVPVVHLQEVEEVVQGGGGGVG